MFYFEEIQGESKFKKTQYDMSFREDWTKDLVECIERMILNGLARKTIINALCAELSFTATNARNLADKVHCKIYKSGVSRKSMMLEKNIIRLEHIYQESMKNGNIPNALKTIDLLNKVCNLYTNNIEVQQTAFTFHLGENTEQQQLPETIDVPIEVIENNEENNIDND